MDCTPWVLDGLWPAELRTATPENTAVADYLRADLRRIAESANQRLRVIAGAGLDEETRRAEESRVFNVARAFAVLRVESTVRQLRKEAIGFDPMMPSLHPPTVDAEPTGTPAPEPREPVDTTGAVEPVAPSPEPAEPQPQPARAQREPEPQPAPAEPQPRRAPAEPQPQPARAQPEPGPRPALESEHQRLQRLLQSVARQEPGLRWAVGLREDGIAVAVTDLAHGWIPPGVELPEGVEPPDFVVRSGSAADMLVGMRSVVTYKPGDPFANGFERERAGGPDRPRPSGGLHDHRSPSGPDPSGLPQRLAEAAVGRRGLPRSVHALVAALAAGTAAPAAGADLVRVHLETALRQLFAQYPETDRALLLNCMLLAAADALVAGDVDAAGYHFAWFGAVQAPRALDQVAEAPRTAPGRGSGEQPE